MADATASPAPRRASARAVELAALASSRRSRAGGFASRWNHQPSPTGSGGGGEGVPLGFGFAMQQSAREKERRKKEREAKAATQQWKGGKANAASSEASDAELASGGGSATASSSNYNPFDLSAKMRRLSIFMFLSLSLSLDIAAPSHDLRVEEMIFVLKMDVPEESASETTNGDNSKPVLDDEASHRLLAETPSRLFVINPAGVFSAAANFESLFAVLAFAGHAIAAGGRCRQCRLQKKTRRIGWRAIPHWIRLR